jgi:hypothetical protein
MESHNFTFIVTILLVSSIVFYGVFRLSKYAFAINWLLIFGYLAIPFSLDENWILFTKTLLLIGCPMILGNIVMYVFIQKEIDNIPDKYKVRFKVKHGKFQINNIKRGASIIGSAGSGKTESVVFNFLQHFSKYSFCGIIHDYKNFEITEMAYPLFKANKIPFYIISFDTIYHRVNPIAPRYMENEESVNEVSRVLIENLLEQQQVPVSPNTLAGVKALYYR